jgi:hypothetical protein
MVCRCTILDTCGFVLYWMKKLLHANEEPRSCVRKACGIDSHDMEAGLNLQHVAVWSLVLL